jgi:hypothetical protein
MQESMNDFPEFFPLCPARERDDDSDYIRFCLAEVKLEGLCDRHRGMKDGRYEWDGLEVIIPRSAVLTLKELARRRGA